MANAGACFRQHGRKCGLDISICNFCVVRGSSHQDANSPVENSLQSRHWLRWLVKHPKPPEVLSRESKQHGQENLEGRVE